MTHRYYTVLYINNIYLQKNKVELAHFISSFDKIKSELKINTNKKHEYLKNYKENFFVSNNYTYFNNISSDIEKKTKALLEITNKIEKKQSQINNIEKQNELIKNQIKKYNLIKERKADIQQTDEQTNFIYNFKKNQEENS